MATKSKRQMQYEQSIMEEVRKIFATFRALRRSYDLLPDQWGIDEARSAFGGFDGNNEHEHLLIAYQLASASRDIHAFNSHFPLLEGYRMMLEQWRRAQDKEALTRAEIIQIIVD